MFFLCPIPKRFEICHANRDICRQLCLKIPKCLHSSTNLFLRRLLELLEMRYSRPYLCQRFRVNLSCYFILCYSGDHAKLIRYPRPNGAVTETLKLTHRT